MQYLMSFKLYINAKSPKLSTIMYSTRLPYTDIPEKSL
jgi:hypothetical protein